VIKLGYISFSYFRQINHYNSLVTELFDANIPGDAIKHIKHKSCRDLNELTLKYLQHIQYLHIF